MAKQKIHDERVVALKRKIDSDAFHILFYALFLLVLAQIYLFDATFAQYAVEAILLIAISIYIVVRNIMAGNDLFAPVENSQKKVVANSIFAGLVVATVGTVLNYARLGDLFKTDPQNTILVAVITFLAASIATFVVFEIIYMVNKKRQAQIAAALNNEDAED